MLRATAPRLLRSAAPLARRLTTGPRASSLAGSRPALRRPGRPTCRLKSTVAAEATSEGAASEAAAATAEPPSRQQLLRLGICVGVPMVGFGFADNFIMILVGDRIDATLGVAFGFSTLAAAGLGNLISDVCGISLGEVIEGWCTRMGLEAPELSAAQSALRATRITKWASGALGISVGCLLGMAPLLFISDRKHVYFSDDDLALFQRQFAQYGVSPEQFFALMQSGTWHSAEQGTMLVRQGETMDRVLLIHTGCAESWTQLPDGSRDNIWIYTGRGDDQPSADPREAALQRTASDAARRGQLRGCIIGGTALVEPEVLTKPYPNQVVVTHDAKYVSWKTEELREAMHEDKSIESAVYSTLYLDLVEGLRRQRNARRPSAEDVGSLQASQEEKHDTAKLEYNVMMRAVVADGLVHPLEKSMLSEFADKHALSDEDFDRALGEVGWSREEWDHGIKLDVMRLRQGVQPSHSGKPPPTGAPSKEAGEKRKKSYTELMRNASRLPDGQVNSADPRSPQEPPPPEAVAASRRPLKQSLTTLDYTPPAPPAPAQAGAPPVQGEQPTR